MANKRGLKFETEKKKQSSKTIRFFGGFLLFVVVFGSISALFVLKSVDFDLSNLFNNNDEETSTGDESTTVAPTFEGKVNFLIYCEDSKGERLWFVSVVKADLKSQSFSVCSLSPKTQAMAGDVDSTLLEHYKSGGAKRLVQAVETLGNLKIDRYIGSDDDGFKNAINKAGSLSVDIPEKINFKNDEITLSLVEGRQGMKGDTLLRYMKYCYFKGDQSLEEQSKMICRMINQYIKAGNVEKGEALFGSIINNMDSDISIVDFTSSVNFLSCLASMPQGPTANAVSGIEELK